MENTLQVEGSLFKNSIKEYYESLTELFSKVKGRAFCEHHTKSIDIFIQSIYNFVLKDLSIKEEPPITLIAMGSYGRVELCVYSDIDLMVVYKESKGYDIPLIIQKLNLLCWDSGLKLSLRAHNINDLFQASSEDVTIKSAMLESRFLCGSKILSEKIDKELEKIIYFEPKVFVEQKLKAYKTRGRKYPLTMEPNIKKGVGGIRDANTLFWIARVMHGIKSLDDLFVKYTKEDDAKEFKDALDFLFTIRAALHLNARKKQDILNLDSIPDIAKRLNYDNSADAQIKLASKTLKSMWTIKVTTQIFIKELTSSLFFKKDNLVKLRNSQISKGFYLCNGVLYTSLRKGPDTLKNILKTILAFDDLPMKYDVSVIKWLRGAIISKEDVQDIFPLFRRALQRSNLNQILYALYKANILHHIIEPMTHTINLPQFDGYHSYPVDIHSLKALRFLENIEDPFVQALYDDICENGKVMLRLTTLFHDYGKGKGGDHNHEGSKIFRDFAKKLNFNDEQIAMGSHLIEHHTLMSNTANREDIYNEKTILSFISKVKSAQALRVLYILTYCDVNAVSSKAYTKFNSKLLRELYNLSLESFNNTSLINEATRRLKKEDGLQKNSDFQALSNSQKRKILSSPSNHLFFKYSPNDIINIFEWANECKGFSYKINNDNYLSIYVVKNINFNVGYLLAKLVIYDLVSMDIFKLFLDTKYFKIDFNKKADEADIAHIKSLIADSFKTNKRADIPKPLILKSDIKFDCDHSKAIAKMTLNCKDQPGLMAYLITIFDENEIDIVSAKIQTIKNRARNMFLLEKDGLLCDNAENIIKLLN